MGNVSFSDRNWITGHIVEAMMTHQLVISGMLIDRYIYIYIYTHHAVILMMAYETHNGLNALKGENIVLWCKIQWQYRINIKHHDGHDSYLIK